MGGKAKDVLCGDGAANKQMKRVMSETRQVKTFSDFGTAIVNSHVPNIKRIADNHKEELAEVFGNYLFDLDGPKQMQSNDLPPIGVFQNKIFARWSGILKSVANLEVGTKFLERFPSGRQTISKGDYLQYHQETYFQNTFILRDRLVGFYANIYRPFALYDEDYDGRVSRGIKDLLKPWAKDLRGKIVHSFENYSEPKLDRLRSLESMHTILTDGEMDESFLRLIRLNLELAKYDAKEKANADIGAIHEYILKVLDVYADLMWPKFFDDVDRVIIPPELSDGHMA